MTSMRKNVVYRKEHWASVLEELYSARIWMRLSSVNSHVPVILRHRFHESIMDFDCSLLGRK